MITADKEHNCIKSGCVNYVGEFGNVIETWSKHFCKAFLSGIPDEIAYNRRKCDDRRISNIQNYELLNYDKPDRKRESDKRSRQDRRVKSDME